MGLEIEPEFVVAFCPRVWEIETGGSEACELGVSMIPV